MEVSKSCGLALLVRSISSVGCLIGTCRVLSKTASLALCDKFSSPTLLRRGFCWILVVNAITLAQYLLLQLCSCFKVHTNLLSDNTRWYACYIWSMLVDVMIATPQYVHGLLIMEFGGMLDVRNRGRSHFKFFAIITALSVVFEFLVFWPEDYLSKCVLDASTLHLIADQQLITTLVVPTAFVNAWALAVALRLIIKRCSYDFSPISNDHVIASLLIVFSFMKLGVWMLFLGQIILKDSTVLWSYEMKNFWLRIGAFTDWLGVLFFYENNRWIGSV